MRYRDSYSFAATSTRPLTQRAIIALLLISGIVLLILARAGNPAVAGTRARMLDMLAPALTAVSKPVTSLRQMTHGTHDLFAAFDENRTLKAENDSLRHWQSVAVALKAENDSLRTLMNYQPVEKVSYVTARVISTSSGAFTHSLMINAGSEDGISALQPVVDARGLIGRVLEVAPHSARVLLLSDVASRVPVITGDSRQHAILAGEGGDLLRLSFVPSDATITLGEAVATTEEGALIPGGIAVGSVFRHDGSGYLVKPLRSLSQAEYVRVIEFSNGTAR